MDTKENLLAAAFDCFQEHGYEKASISMITERCNITKGAFYHHFKTKEEVYLAVMNNFFYEIEKWIRERIYSSENMETLIHKVLNYTDYFDKSSFARNVSEQHYSIVFDTMRRFPDFRRRIGKIYSGCMDLFEQRVADAQISGEIKKTINPETFAAHLFSVAEGFVLMTVLFHDDQTIKEKGDKIATELWQLIKK